MSKPRFTMISLDDPEITPRVRVELERIAAELFRLEARVEVLEDAARIPRLVGEPRPVTAEEIARVKPQRVTIAGKSMTLLVIPPEGGAR